MDNQFCLLFKYEQIYKNNSLILKLKVKEKIELLVLVFV